MRVFFEHLLINLGFQVFARNCANCHGMIGKQYDYQEWDERDRYIHDHIYPPYFSQDQGKNANGGVWPSDFTKIRLRPGGINYIYNIMTGYHFKAPYGIDVPKGKHF